MPVTQYCPHNAMPGICLICAAESMGLPPAYSKPFGVSTCPHGADGRHCHLCVNTLKPGGTTELAATVKIRDAIYGGFENVARITQMFKSIMKTSPSYIRMNDVQKEAMEMVLHKCARLLSGDPAHRDSWHDIQGYAKLAEDRLPPEVISTPIIRQQPFGGREGPLDGRN